MRTHLEPSCLVGLIGSGIQASRTPAMHEREGTAQGIRYIYKLIDLDRLGLDASALPDLLMAAERMGFAGLNITHPCKQAVLSLLHDLSPDAAAIGAVNTVVLRDGKRVGHNTDWFGFAENVRRNLPDATRERVVQLGAGGAGSAVAHALLTLGVRHLSISDIDAGRAGMLAEGLARRFSGAVVDAVTDVANAVANAVEQADGLVNTTPMGMVAHPGLPLPRSLLRPTLWVAEIVYFPMETELLRQARAIGCRTLDGGGMAVFQAVEAFRLFTGVAPDAARMQAHFAAMDAAG